VTVEDHQAPQTGAGDTLADLRERGEGGLRRKAERAAEMRVFPAHADRERRQHAGEHTGPQLPGRLGDETERDVEIVESGRCSPCCSIAASGSTATARRRRARRGCAAYGPASANKGLASRDRGSWGARAQPACARHAPSC
jgi:hypothetical protein